MTTIDTCPLCGGDKAAGRTTVTVDLDTAVIVVRKVPAKVCRQCGERWIERETSYRLEALVQEARRKPTEVEILHWQDAA